MNTSPLPGGDALDAQGIQELAGEYVLGTLSLEERQAVEAQLPRQSALRAAVDAWEQRLLPLLSLVEPVEPSRHLWRRLERSLDHLPLAAADLAPQPVRARANPLPWWRDLQSLSLWRGLTAGGFAAAAVLAAVMLLEVGPQPASTRYMVVLVAPQDKAPGWIVQTSADRQMELIPLGQFEIPQDKVLELWTKADAWNAPVSLGLVTAGKRLTVSLDQLPGVQANQLFELTLEPRGGSPTGRPTGPIHFIGRSVNVS